MELHNVIKLKATCFSSTDNLTFLKVSLQLTLAMLGVIISQNENRRREVEDVSHSLWLPR